MRTGREQSINHRRSSTIILINDDSGALLVMALMILVILAILGTAVLGVTSMEVRVSRDYYNQKQALEAADAGVEWAIEKIYTEVLQGENFVLVDPDSDPDCVKGIQSEDINGQSVEWNINMLGFENDTSGDPPSNQFLYTFESTGTYNNEVSKTITVKVAYPYNYEVTGKWVDEDNRGIIAYSINQ